MSSPFTPYLLAFTVLAALGSGLVAGLFFGFSTAVMKALARLPPAQGMKAMQDINVVILNPVFLGVFMGTALISAVLMLGALLAWSGPQAAWLLAGAAAYLVGTFGVTMVANVPLNNLLAATDAASTQARETWAIYLAKWVRWNHLRTLMGTLAALCFTLAASGLRGLSP